jgi:hypothetical protein
MQFENNAEGPVVMQFENNAGGPAVMQFELTPKAFANVSPGLEPATTLGSPNKFRVNPERVPRLANPFRVSTPTSYGPMVLASSNPGLKLANAFGVNFQTASLH